MRVVFEKSMLEKITETQRDAEVIGKKISRIELSTEEMDELVRDLGGYCPMKPYCPRTVPFKGFNIVEVF